MSTAWSEGSETVTPLAAERVIPPDNVGNNLEGNSTGQSSAALPNGTNNSFTGLACDCKPSFSSRKRTMRFNKGRGA